MSQVAAHHPHDPREWPGDHARSPRGPSLGVWNHIDRNAYRAVIDAFILYVERLGAQRDGRQRSRSHPQMRESHEVRKLPSWRG